MASDRALYVVSDVHGHLDKLTAALHTTGLIDEDHQWSGGNTRLWFLGDLFDRGSDGAGVVELIMRLNTEAAAVGGTVDTLLGNHEILMLGAQRFGTEELADDEGNVRNFDLWWKLNGGQDSDVAKLTDKQLSWLRNRAAMAYVDDNLLVHTDTTEYASYGRSINAVNRAVRKIVKSSDAAKWWALFRRMTIRHRFEAEDGPQQAAAMLDFFGGSLLVHGHSTIPDRLGIPGEEVNGARLYCEDLVLCVDGGMYQGGPCLVTPLPVTPESLHTWPAAEPEPAETDSAAVESASASDIKLDSAIAEAEAAFAQDEAEAAFEEAVTEAVEAVEAEAEAGDGEQADGGEPSAADTSTDSVAATADADEGAEAVTPDTDRTDDSEAVDGDHSATAEPATAADDTATAADKSESAASKR